MTDTSRNATAVVLIARTAVSAKPLQELEQLASRLSADPGGRHVTFTFTEQGEPALRAVVQRLRDERFGEVVLVPLLLPMEPSFAAFIARTLQRWQAESPGAWPQFRIHQQGLANVPAFADVLTALVDQACVSPLLEPPTAAVSEGSLVAVQKHRVFVCMGGPCMAAGAAIVWGHLRNEQKRLNLRTSGKGMMSAKTSCLGPCGLAPVLQVFPEDVCYGGVTEAGVDRIIDEHLGRDRVVEALAYAPSATRQHLRHGTAEKKEVVT